MNIEYARGLAAQAWCAPTTQDRIMDPPLAEEFAKILMREVNTAMNIIAGPECEDTP